MASRFELNGELFEYTPTPKKGLPLGVPLTNTDVAGNTVEINFPGILRAEWTPTVGYSENDQSPINLASQKVYKAIQNALRQRNLTYQRTDVIVNILSNDSIHITFEDVKRAIKAYFTYNKYNRYYGAKLLEALGYDYDSFDQHKAELIPQMIKWRNMLELYPLPDVINFVGIHNEMASNIYVDTVSDKAQLYVFVPRKVFTYADVDTGGGKGLEYIDFHGDTPLTWDQVVTFMSSLISAMTNSTDFDIINAALMSTYEGSMYVDTSVPTEGEELIPAQNVIFDNAMMNAVAVGDLTPFDEGTSNLAPIDTGYNALYTINMKAATCSGLTNYYVSYINSLTDSPSSIEMANYMRWHPEIGSTVAPKDQTGITAGMKSWGTEIINYFKIYTLSNIKVNGVSATTTTDPTKFTTTIDNYTGATQYSTIETFFELSAFKNHPIIQYRATIQTSPTQVFASIPISQWNYVSVAPSAEPYHEALLWYAFAERKSSAPVPPEESSGKSGKR